MKTNLLTAMRNSQGFSRTITYLIALAVIGVVLERTIYYTLLDADIIEAESPIDRLYRVAPQKARQLGLPNPNQTAAVKEKTSDAKLSASILKTRDTLDVLAYELHRDGGDASKAQQQLTELHSQLQTQDEQAMAGFQKVGRHIEKHQLAAIIKERHQNAVESYRKDMDILLNNLQTALTSKDSNTQFEAVMAARKHLEGKQLERSQQPFDPNNLPHKSMQPNPDNKPKLTLQEFADAGLVNNPLTQYASHGSYNFGNLAGASNPAYLAETDEVKITPAIQAKADELQHDPVLIYNWVRNNIEWIPSWGAMQDSDITLGSQRGNAMDIASLLIALYRASGIPSRYVHGTIELPADKFKNWAGGFESTEAAADFAASGGIPTGIGIEGGVATVVSMEHIWVEAAIDYQPSRGAINRDADSWVSMDASFKQYAFLDGLDVEQTSSLDVEQLFTSFVNSGTVNEQESSANGFDSSIILDAQQQAQNSLRNNINTNLPNAGVSDLIGGRLIVEKNSITLPSSLSSYIQVLGVRYAQLPIQLQARVTFMLGTGLDENGLPIEPVTLAWSEVNNYKVTLSFRPASIEDTQALESLLPEGGITDMSQVPNTIPAYLVNMVPELRLNESIIGRGPALGLGSDLDFNYSIKLPAYGTASYSNRVIVGSHLNILSIGGSISAAKFTKLESDANLRMEIINSGDLDRISELTGNQVVGDMYYSGGISYFGQYMSMMRVASLNQQVFQEFLPSNGTFGYVPNVNYFFGFVQSVTHGGIEMDISNVSTFTGASDADSNKRVDFVQQSGMISSILESTVPQQMFGTLDNNLRSYSAISLIAKAMDLGQRIFRITADNRNITMQNIMLDSAVISEINRALDTGKEVITHASEITETNFSGAGYIILDAETGSAAYKISGGLNGSKSYSATLGIFFGLAIVGLIILQFLTLGPAAFALIATTVITAFVGIFMAMVFLGSFVNVSVGCFLAGLLWGMTAMVLGSAKLGGLLIKWMSSAATLAGLSVGLLQPNLLECYE